MYDLIIRNGTVIDGSGKEGFVADVAITGGKIAAIGVNLGEAKQMLDATGLTVTPGFVDSHSHSDNSVISFPQQMEKIEQGITMSIGGCCGSSAAPALDENGNLETFGSFMEQVAEMPLGSGLATYVGHSSLRKAVMGSENREPTGEELEKMADLLRDGIRHGALGLSFGLIYIPGCFAKTEELVYLAKVAAAEGGMLSAHIRNESEKLLEACEEFIEVVRQSGARGVLSHHKSAYRENWGKVKESLERIRQAKAEGLELWCDVYPYIASHTSLYARFIPRKYCSGGTEGILRNLADPEIRAKIRQENIDSFGDDDLSWAMIVHCPAFPQYVGLRLNEVAKRHGKDVYETVFDILEGSRNVCNVCYFTMCEEDVETVIAFPDAMICTDSSVARNHSAYHPRLRGTFPRALGKYVRERGVVSLPEMIRKMTSLPAYVYSLAGKGLLQEGYDADICIFDADTIRDRCDFTHPHERAEGLRYVLVDGKVVVEDAVFNGTRAAKLVRRKV